MNNLLKKNKLIYLNFTKLLKNLENIRIKLKKQMFIFITENIIIFIVLLFKR